MPQSTKSKFWDGPYAIFGWLGIAFLWLVFPCSSIAMTSRGWGASPFVWIPMMLAGGWGIWFTFRKKEERSPGFKKRAAMDVVVGLITMYVVHKIWSRNRP